MKKLIRICVENIVNECWVNLELILILFLIIIILISNLECLWMLKDWYVIKRI